MAMRRVAGHVSQRLLKGREEVRNYFTDPVKDALKYEAQIVKREDYVQQKLEELKYEFWRHQSPQRLADHVMWLKLGSSG
ncbi:hypothetical protein MKW94_029228 [Papaver nudicaule]|uniref:Uncharacterized protein n=1 Tax=Papaver nudicaule TaxID=74823 RepID=A0AA41VBL5_PAPNU|nr:hypothetical protein [Papaver nudicaule]